MKRKKSDASETIVSTAEDIVQTAADKLGPIAQLAADRLEEAANRVGPLAHDAADKVAPLAQQAADRVSPFAQQAADRVSPLAQQVGGYANQLGESVGPYALLARQRAAQSAHDIIERWRPTLEEAMERVSPSIDAARDRINDDVLPKLIAALEAAAAAPMVQEASKRGQATLAAAKGELALPEPARKKRHVIRTVLIVAAVGGAVAVVARKLLAGQDADWQAARPTAPYAPPKPPAPTAPATPASNGQGATSPVEAVSAPIAAEDSAEQQPPEATPAEGALAEPVAVTSIDLPAETVEETSDTTFDAATSDTEPGASTEIVADDSDEIEDGVAPDADRSRYSGDDVYVGSEPPEGFLIKANERSMKYHLPESMGYQRTHTEVWFTTEEAAQEAGFIRAQR